MNNLELHHHPTLPPTHSCFFLLKKDLEDDRHTSIADKHMLLGVTKLNIKMKNHGDKFNRELTWAWDSHAQQTHSVFTECLYTRYKALIEGTSFSSQEAHI